MDGNEGKLERVILKKHFKQIKDRRFRYIRYK